ncbi:MAG: chorismate mutase [Alphaproteobacteria bacterium]|nr:chorismate mutase [Alphaproteobacteria bacterium]
MNKLQDRTEIQKILNNHRIQIDNLDDDIIELISKRFEIIKQVAKIKKQYNIPAHLQDRVDQVMNRNIENAVNSGINIELIKSFYADLIDKSIKLEEELLKK